MTKSPAELQREQRLAAKLRENLKRRKSQARARSSATDSPVEPTESADPPGLAREPDSDR